MHERTTRIVVAGLSRFMDELPVIILGLIAMMIVGGGNQNLVEKIVLAIVTGLLGYMKGKADNKASAPPPAGPQA